MSLLPAISKSFPWNVRLVKQKLKVFVHVPCGSTQSATLIFIINFANDRPIFTILLLLNSDMN